MARKSTTYDPFNAVAEPKRRLILETIARNKELSVNDIVQLLKRPQPMISKHLSVLKTVGLVNESRVGRLRLYRVNPKQLKLIHDWVTPFERSWNESFDRIDEMYKDFEIRKKQQ